MSRFLLCAVLMFFLHGEASAGAFHKFRVGRGGRSCVVKERVVDLPMDSKKCYVSLCLHSDWQNRPNELRLVSWFQNDPRLKQLKSRVHFHIYHEKHPHFRAVFSKTITRLPTVLIQENSGRVLMKDSEDLPVDVREMGNRVEKIFPLFPNLDRPVYIFPWRRPKPCPQPVPEPEPRPDLDEEVVVPLVPDVVPDPDPAPVEPVLEPEQSFPWGWAVLAVLLTGGATGVIKFRREIGM